VCAPPHAARCAPDACPADPDRKGAAVRAHDHDFEDGQRTRPPGARLQEEPTPDVQLALGAGRGDTLGAGGLLRLQRLAGNSGVGSLLGEEESPVKDVVSGGGRPLEPELQADMGARLGADFSDVRVHTDDHASTSARSVNAHAYTVGSHIVFQRDAYAPDTATGRQTIAHELTHVLQQRQGPVDGTPAPGGIRVSHPSDRFEQEAARNAERAMTAPAAPVAQRAAADEEQPEEEPGATAQGLFVQRAEEEEPEE
jgi:hypothetical protein